MRTLFIRLNNWLVRRREFRLSPDRVLMLGPRCLQNSECPRNIVLDPRRCQQCGRCDIAELISLADRRGVRIAFVTGGGMARDMLRSPEVQAVVAFACEAELIGGLLHRRRKPALVIPITRPHGPCRDTRVSLASVEEAISFFLGS